MTTSSHHPPGFERPGDSHLPAAVKRLRQVLFHTQREFAYDTLRLDRQSIGELAGILVEFAEDLHNGTGIWDTYERYNTELFGTALPLVAEVNVTGSSTAFHPDRFRYFLWTLYPVFADGLELSPGHPDLRRVAQVSSACLSDVFSAIPRDSGVKAFLGSSSKYGDDVKRKLIWLGTRSFMFRTLFARFMDESGRDSSVIAKTDDFICQECTRWSGLGAIDILAGVLDISDQDRKDLRSWYERHAAFYRIESAGDEMLHAVNVINDQPYRIRINVKPNPFKPGSLVSGSLTPWRGEWYWSGSQSSWPDASKVDISEVVRSFKRHTPAIVCRYSKTYEALVRERMADLYGRMLAFQGKDLVVYPDGLSMAADWEKEFRADWDSMPEQEQKEAMEKHGLKKPGPDMKLPKQLLDEKNGVGVFLNPDEGKEIMTYFTPLMSGLKKKGNGLTEDEEGAVRGFIDSKPISPRFVRRVLEEYGDESVRSAFKLKGDLPGYWLDYLLRSRKGAFYRKRYPSLSVT
jgi:hypothetical protein